MTTEQSQIRVVLFWESYLLVYWSYNATQYYRFFVLSERLRKMLNISRYNDLSADHTLITETINTTLNFHSKSSKHFHRNTDLTTFQYWINNTLTILCTPHILNRINKRNAKFYQFPNIMLFTTSSHSIVYIYF